MSTAIIEYLKYCLAFSRFWLRASPIENRYIKPVIIKARTAKIKKIVNNQLVKLIKMGMMGSLGSIGSGNPVPVGSVIPVACAIEVDVKKVKNKKKIDFIFFK